MVSYCLHFRLLILQPEDPIPFMVQFLEDSKGTGEHALSQHESEELVKLRKQFEKLKLKLGDEYEDAKVDDEE